MTAMPDIFKASNSRHNIMKCTIEKCLRLLVAAPHPDDFEVMGVALKFLADRRHFLKVNETIQRARS